MSTAESARDGFALPLTSPPGGVLIIYKESYVPAEKWQPILTTGGIEHRTYGLEDSRNRKW
jgi:hypothetical protein